MDGGAWQATVPGVARVGHQLATKPPPLSWWHYTPIKLSLWNNSSRPNKHFNFFFWTQFEAFQDLSSLMISGHGIKSARKFPTNFKKLQIIVTYYSDFVLKLILA